MFRPLLLPLLLIGSVGEVMASALFGRPRPPSDGAMTLALDKREGSFTTFSTIFSGGDASNTRKALSGYDIRVDLANGAWGFCDSNNAGQCDMAGTCVDDYSCSSGCGFANGNTVLKTWTCSYTKDHYCSTALLTLSSDSPRVFTYLACGDKPSRTEEYKAFTTSSKSSTSSSTAAPLATLTQTSQTTTSGTSSSATSTSQSATQPSSTTTATSATGTGTLNTASTSPTPSSERPNNTPAIIGAVVGCVALICICIVAVFFLRRRRNASAAAAAAEAATTTTTTTTAGGSGPGRQAGAELEGVVPAWAEFDWAAPSVKELPGRGPAAYDTSERDPAVGAGREYPAMSPVELPGTGGWGR